MSIRLLKILTKELLLSENIFYISPDADYPGKKQTVIFSTDEEYKIDGNTHGLESHAIKHYKEFAPSRIEAEMAGAKRIIQDFDDVFILNNKGVIVQTGDKAKNNINTNSLLNMFDLINDKQKNNIPLNDSEIALEPVLQTLTKEYNDLISYYIDSYIDIDNIDNAEEIMEILDSGKIVKFTGKYNNTLYNYYMDPTNTGLVAQNLDGTLVTLFRIDKKGADLNKVAGYFRRGVKLTNPVFAKAIGVLNENSKVLKMKITERRLRSIIRNVIKEDIGKLPDYKEKLNSMVIEYKYCSNGFADEIDCGFSVNEKEIDFESMIFPDSEDILFKLLYAIFPDIEEDLEDQVVEHIKVELGKEQLNKFYSDLDDAREEADNYKTREFGDDDQFNPYY